MFPEDPSIAPSSSGETMPDSPWQACITHIIRAEFFPGCRSAIIEEAMASM